MADKYTIYRDAEHPGKWQVVEKANPEHRVKGNLSASDARDLAKRMNARGK